MMTLLQFFEKKNKRESPCQFALLIAAIFLSIYLSSVKNHASLVEFNELMLAGCNTDCGRVLMKEVGSGEYFPICSKRWSLKEANVVCRTLGFDRAFAAFPNFGGSAKKPRAVNVTCKGTEQSLRECVYILNHENSGFHCTPEEVVGVACTAKGASTTDAGILKEASDAVKQWKLRQDFRHENVKRKWNVTEKSNSFFRCKVDPLIPRPFTTEQAKEAFVYFERVEEDYKSMDETLLKRLCNGNSGKQLQKKLVELVERGLRWNALGMDLTQIEDVKAYEIDLITELYLSYNPHALIHNELDQPLRKQTNTLENVEDFNTLQRDGYLFVNDFGLSDDEIDNLAFLSEELFNVTKFENSQWKDVAKLSSTSSGLVVTARISIPILEVLFQKQNRFSKIINKYLGPSFLDGYKVTKLATKTVQDEQSYVASRWHHDRTGRRLKLFIYLKECDCENGHPTQIAIGTGSLVHYRTDSLHATRFKDEYIRKTFDVVSACGRKGTGFIFDTHTIHRATPEGSNNRTTVIMEFHNRKKCAAIRELQYPLPCPSGDQFMIQKPLI